MYISLCSIEQQQKIVDVLDKVENLIDKRQQQLNLLDGLIKSRFIEMFGDLAINNKQWQIMKFTDCAIIDTNMILNFNGYENYSHIGIDSIEKNTGKIFGYRTVKEDRIITGKYLFSSEHIIYIRIRPNLNKIALPTFNGVCSADAYSILPKKDVCNRNFLAHVLRSSVFLNYILNFSKYTNLPKVNKIRSKALCFQCHRLNYKINFLHLLNRLKK